MTKILFNSKLNRLMNETKTIFSLPLFHLTEGEKLSRDKELGLEKIIMNMLRPKIKIR